MVFQYKIHLFKNTRKVKCGRPMTQTMETTDQIGDVTCHNCLEVMRREYRELQQQRINLRAHGSGW